MSFLTRRKLHRHRDNPLADNFNLGALPEDDTASLQTPSVLQTPSIKSTNLRKRLSSFSLLASTLKRGRSQSSQQQPQAAVGFISPFRARSRSRSPSPPPSLEIRRPSGLGRRASVIDLLSGQAGDHAQSVYGTSERKHSISTPELTLRPNGLLQWSHLPDTKPTARTPPRLPKPTPIVTRIPTDLLKTVFSFADLADLASAARVCKAFVEPVRVLLYEHIDLVRAVDGRRVEKCVSLLASRRDLAGLVQQFACDAVPPMLNAGGRTAFSVVTFAIALNNMHSLSSLTIPRFDAPLLFHTTFHLSNLTVLCDRISNDDIHGTFDWLRSQPSLTSLSFPNLVLEESNLQLLSTTSSQQESPSIGSEQDAISQSLFAPDVLPKLAELRGPSSLVAALVPGRPLTSIQLQIHSTIYDGLRPSAILAGIAKSSSPVTRLGFKASPQTRVDARTIERLLMSAGSELGAHVQTLEIECALEDEVRIPL